MARDLHPEQVANVRQLQRNFRAIETLLDALIDSGGSLEAFLLGGRAGGQIGYGGVLTAEDLELHSNPSEDGQLVLGIVTIDEATGAVAIDLSSGQQLKVNGAANADLNFDANGSANILVDRGTTGSFSHIQHLTAGVLKWRAGLTNDTTDDWHIGPSASVFVLTLSRSGRWMLLHNAASEPGTPSNSIALASRAVAGRSELFVYNEEGQRVRVTGLDTRTTADFSMTADATLADVTGLFRNVDAGKTYSFVFRLYDQMSALGGYSLQLNGTCTATYLIAHFHRHPVASTLFSMSNSVTSLGHTAVGEATPGSASGYIECRGTIEVNAAGTFGIKFAQNSASGTSTIKRGSTLHLREIT